MAKTIKEYDFGDKNFLIDFIFDLVDRDNNQYQMIRMLERQFNINIVKEYEGLHAGSWLLLKKDNQGIMQLEIICSKVKELFQYCFENFKVVE